MDENLKNELASALQKVFDERQERPNQYVVAYYKLSDDSLIGYHASTFCQLTDDILKAKRYSGENPYPQLETISKNLKYTLDTEKHEGMFASINNAIKEDFGGLKSSDLYMDAISLVEGTPKQNLKVKIL